MTHISPLTRVCNLVRQGKLPEAAGLLAKGGVVQAGGIGDIALDLEKRCGWVEAADLPSAKKRLHELEADFDASYKRFTRLSPQEKNKFAEELLHTDEVKNPASPAQLSQFHDAIRTFGFLQDFFSRRFSVVALFPDGQMPATLTDLLLQRPGKFPALGHCQPISTLAGHLVPRQGIKLEVLLHTKHVNLYHSASGLVLEMAIVPNFLSTIQYWRAQGLFGDQEKPAPLESLIAGLLMNLGNPYVINDDGLSKVLVEAALKIYPDFPSALVNLADLSSAHGDDQTAEVHLKRAVELNPNYFDAYLSLVELYDRQGKIDETIEAAEAALKAVARNAESASQFSIISPDSQPSTAQIELLKRNLRILASLEQ